MDRPRTPPRGPRGPRDRDRDRDRGRERPLRGAWGDRDRDRRTHKPRYDDGDIEMRSPRRDDDYRGSPDRRYRDRERDRRDRERERDRDRDRDRDRERDRDRDRRDRGRERDYDRERDRERDREKDRDNRDRDYRRPPAAAHSAHYSRSRSPYSHSPRSRTRTRSPATTPPRGRPIARSPPPSSLPHASSITSQSPPGDRKADEGVDVAAADGDDEAKIAALLGFGGGFGTTKGKKVRGNDVYAVSKDKKATYRQYMNRVGGFNRALSPS
ncbi:hypothetical protein BDZ91DRAFT_484867 [Kalaharituber pfeilii]|nr:hypothetical protein BDZ91DRAFT_484867 [Kalaharituber pfeilii]